MLAATFDPFVLRRLAWIGAANAVLPSCRTPEALATRALSEPMSALTFATAQLLRVLPRAGVSRVMGKLADHSWSPPLGRAVVGLYTRAYDVRLDECQQQGGWESFDQFFTRPLRQDARPLSGDERTIVSPADG